MVTNNHISVKRSKKTTANLKARITFMEEIVKKGVIPDGFDYHQSDKNLFGWQNKELGINKVGINTARDNYPQQWEQLQTLRRQIKAIEKKSTQAKKKAKSKTKESISQKNNDHKRTIKKLTNELITVRSAYLDLLQVMQQDARKNRVTQDAIRRHFQHYGLQSTLREKDEQ